MIFTVGAAADDRDPVHYAFASYLGNGFYSGADRDVFVLNVPFKVDPKGGTWAPYRFRLPVSVGFFDFDFLDAPENVPESVATMTFIPGIERRFQLSDSWSLTPYVDLGVGYNFSTDLASTIYSTGVAAELEFGGNHAWVSRVFYAGYYTPANHDSNDFGAFQTGVELSVATFALFGRDVRLAPFAMGYWYFDALKFIRPGQSAADVVTNGEVGVSLIFEQPISLIVAKIPRVALSYRFGDGVSAWRIVFSRPI
ncbi:MAG: hypothetical protein O7H40_16895 [Gammaproteobacteria bacterium]|nr:hypothetical protein [Gammaproteobacteria bacterium]